VSAGTPLAPRAPWRHRLLAQAWPVFTKELRDALRDRRTLLTMLVSAVLMGPLMLVALSLLVADLETRAESRELLAVGLDSAPTLRNYLLRQNRVLLAAPPDHEQQLADRRLGQAVLVVPPGFEADLAAGLLPQLRLVSASANLRAQGSAQTWQRLLQGFNQEQATLRLALRGVPPAALHVVQVDEEDLAGPLARAAQFTRLLPYFVLMAVVYGALNAALDTTAGERERGSLEPLLMTPVSRGALVLGKWGAVAAVGMGVALLSCFSFLSGQWLLRSETLAAMFHFGLREAALFLALLLPMAALVSALLMAVAIRCRTFKEAQASGTVVVVLMSLVPMVALFNQGGEPAWYRWVPALAQFTLMNRVLEAEALAPAAVLAPLLVAALGTALALVYVTRQLRGAALR
jgi:sodium transport system permease protein